MKEKKTEPFINIGTGENVYLYIFIAIVEVCLYARYFFDVMRNQPSNKSVY